MLRGYSKSVICYAHYKRYRAELSYIHGLGLRNREREMLRPINELNLTLIVQFKAPWTGKGPRGTELRF
jgi:hypothetical protein